MSQEQKFQPVWDMRKKDNEFGSSSDDAKSGSNEHKIFSSFIYPQENDNDDNPTSQQPNVQNYLSTSLKAKGGPKKKNTQAKNQKRKSPVKDGDVKKKSKPIIKNPISMDDLKMFRASVIEELNVERESRFARMVGEMNKLVSVELPSMPKIEKTISVPKKRPVRVRNKKNQKPATNNFDKVLNEELKVETDVPNEKKEGENSKSSVKKTTKAHVDEEQRINISLKNISQPDDANTDHGYFTGIQEDGPFGNLAYMGFKHIGLYDLNNTQPSTSNSGFAIPLHNRLDSGFNIPSQVVTDYQSQENGFSGRNQTLPEHTIANNFHGHVSYKPEAGLKAAGKRKIHDDHLYRN